MRVVTAFMAAWLLVAALAGDGVAAPAWVRVSSPNFTVVSNAGERSARGVAWQFEQVRAVLQRLWPWAQLDTGRPILIFALRDEASVRALAPSYWEHKGGLRPATVFLNAPDRHYVILRTDIDASQRDVNPYRLAYWSYIGIVLDATFGRPLPPWFTRGLAEVMSNTIVRGDDLTFGQVVPWHLRRLQQGSRLPLDQVMGATSDSKFLEDASWLELFDASAWALVHYLMFGEQGANIPRLNKAATDDVHVSAGGRGRGPAAREVRGQPARPRGGCGHARAVSGSERAACRGRRAAGRGTQDRPGTCGRVRGGGPAGRPRRRHRGRPGRLREGHRAGWGELLRRVSLRPVVLA
ncbi:MAG: hypothetical protein MUF60_11190 [Vicinamibacterales bacterium]|nr:hypothetical protein [Vicinamibacterales bacterium]